MGWIDNALLISKQGFFSDPMVFNFVWGVAGGAAFRSDAFVAMMHGTTSARHTLFLHDDNDFSTLPPEFIAKAVKFLSIRDDAHGLLLDPVPHVLYRNNVHEECGFMDEEHTDLLAILRANASVNIVPYADVAAEIDDMKNDEGEKDGDGEERVDDDE